MPANRMFPRRKLVRFVADDCSDIARDTACAANDNTCPYCGGVLEPGDRAEDCSGSGAWPMLPFPQGWGASC